MYADPATGTIEANGEVGPIGGELVEPHLAEPFWLGLRNHADEFFANAHNAVQTGAALWRLSVPQTAPPLPLAGELLIGIALILGAFTGIAAFMGGFMNWNFMMAGSASVNPVFFVIAVGLILAWKVSGYIGVDYFLLPWLGTPWGRKRAEANTASVPTIPVVGEA